MNRRGFFRLVAGAAIAPVVAKAAALLPPVPILWGDGVHDDTEALNALFRGDVVEFADVSMSEGVGWSECGTACRFPSGMFRITAPIDLHFEGKDAHFSWTDATMFADDGDGDGDWPMICINGGGKLTFTGLHLIGRIS